MRRCNNQSKLWRRDNMCRQYRDNLEQRDQSRSNQKTKGTNYISLSDEAMRHSYPEPRAFFVNRSESPSFALRLLPCLRLRMISMALTMSAWMTWSFSGSTDQASRTCKSLISSHCSLLKLVAFVNLPSEPWTLSIPLRLVSLAASWLSLVMYPLAQSQRARCTCAL